MSSYRLAYFISPHGFGHAARSAAIMGALQARDPAIRFEIFTQVPRWFFEDSRLAAFDYHDLLTDIGMVQHTALRADVSATRQRLDAFLPFDPAHLARLAAHVQARQCTLVISDIAPLGLAVAQTAGLPSVLVENFTWDWLYDAYAAHDHCLLRHITYLRGLFATASYHIQTEPVCCRRTVDLLTSPVSRQPLTPAAEIRAQLALPRDAPVVLITMGGTPMQFPFLQQLAEQPAITFVIPGAEPTAPCPDNVVLLPQRTGFCLPELVGACDAVVSKVGYSIVAEAYHAGIPLGYVPREHFRESPALAAYIEQHLPSLAIAETDFHAGTWLAQLPELLARPRLSRHGPNGADEAARFIYQLLQGSSTKADTSTADYCPGR